MDYEELHAEAETIVQNVSVNQLAIEEKLRSEIDKMAVIIPFLDAKNYSVYETALGALRMKEDYTNSSLDVNYSLFISQLEEHQQRKIEEVVKYKIEKIYHLDELESYVDHVMNSRLSDLEDLVSREQLEILMNNDDGLEREVIKGVLKTNEQFKSKVSGKKKKAFEMER